MKLSFNNEREIKMFSNKEKLNKFFASKTALQTKFQVLQRGEN